MPQNPKTNGTPLQAPSSSLSLSLSLSLSVYVLGAPVTHAPVRGQKQKPQ